VIVLVGDTPPLPEDEADILHLIDKFTPRTAPSTPST
jgi:hypothetical protein